MGHVFISYASEDRAKVSKLAKALQALGIEVWFDEQLKAGDHFDLAIERALAAAHRVIVVWSPASCASRWVRAEAADGADRQILIPIMIEETTLPLEFRRIQTLDFKEWDGPLDSVQIERLVEAIANVSTLGELSKVSSHGSAPQSYKSEETVLAPTLVVNAVNATRYFGSNFRFRVKIDNSNISIRHVDLGLLHWVSVDGKRVTQIAFPREFYRFEFSVEGRLHTGELSFVVENWTSVREILFSLDGEQILRHNVGWKDGLVSAVLIFLLVISSYYLIRFQLFW